MEFGNAANRWVNTSIAFFETVPRLSSQNFEYANSDVAVKIQTFASKFALEEKSESDDQVEKCLYTLPLKELPILALIVGKSTQAIKAADVMSQSTLSALVSEYESFLVSFLKVLGSFKPEAFINKDETIRLGDIEKYESLSEVKSKLVEAKIDDMMRSETHINVIQTLEKKFGVNLSSDKSMIADFVEICQRRHLITHAGGIVSKRYIEICLDAGCDPENLPKLGEKVKVGRRYLRRATARVFQIGYFSLHVIWQKILPEDHETSCTQILTTSHDFLENGLTKMSRRCANFLLNSKRKPSERVQAYVTVNLALSYLLDDSLDDEFRCEKVTKVLDERDWSIVSPTIELALACLKRNFDDLERLSKAAYDDGVDFYAASTWMVFSEARSSTEFLSYFPRELDLG